MYDLKLRKKFNKITAGGLLTYLNQQAEDAELKLEGCDEAFVYLLEDEIVFDCEPLDLEDAREEHISFATVDDVINLLEGVDPGLAISVCGQEVWYCHVDEEEEVISFDDDELSEEYDI